MLMVMMMGIVVVVVVVVPRASFPTIVSVPGPHISISMYTTYQHINQLHDGKYCFAGQDSVSVVERLKTYGKYMDNVDWRLKHVSPSLSLW